MLQKEFVHFFHQYLDQLHSEITDYPSENLMWVVVEGINNSGGNLCTHLIGNLNHYIGQVIGNTGYQRNRPLEFSCMDVPREQLLKDIEATKTMIETVVSGIEDLTTAYPPEVFGRAGSIQHFLLHLLAHLGYHIGQVNYHRRILEGVEMG